MIKFFSWPKFGECELVSYLRGYENPIKSRNIIKLLHKLVLFLFYVVFQTFSDQRLTKDKCTHFAALSYTLLMSAVFLTAFQAIQDIKVLVPGVEHLQIILRPHLPIAVSLLIPIIASILLMKYTDFFIRGDGFCWIRHDYIFYGVIIPTTILVVNAILCTGLVVASFIVRDFKLRKLVRHRGHQFKQRILAVILFQATFGSLWVIQFFTLYSPYTTAWHYAFTAVLGSQGTLLVLAFLYKRKCSLERHYWSLKTVRTISGEEING
ncbi:hypothetical protein ANCCAN_04609 [Ancylostoma caninum]|uniref:G-protein coupled receptors family 2 profile 2 domain-containing protein n=1 Tax=Ancylostoma caninum TaxID=29170 RepID=A0A368H0P9_ANCCA|nr:hypothetical protein ANCCAN_04609 [Ancylostoma caninum]